MKHANNGNALASAARWQKWTAPRAERGYLQDQMDIARADMRQSLIEMRGSLPRLLHPRLWIQFHPVAGSALLLGALAAALSAIRAPGQSDAPRGARHDERERHNSGPAPGVSDTAHASRRTWVSRVRALGTGLLRSTGRTVLGIVVAEFLRAEPGVLTQQADAGSAECKDPLPYAAER